MRQKGSTSPFPGPAGISFPPPAGGPCQSHRGPRVLGPGLLPSGRLPGSQHLARMAHCPSRGSAWLVQNLSVQGLSCLAARGHWFLWLHIFLPQGSVCRTLPYHNHSLADIILSPSYKYHFICWHSWGNVLPDLSPELPMLAPTRLFHIFTRMFNICLKTSHTAYISGRSLLRRTGFAHSLLHLGKGQLLRSSCLGPTLVTVSLTFFFTSC